jgi:membrane protein YdbS with pleckstrin-like domain
VYAPIKRLALSLLKAPSEPPEPPAGRHESVQVYRASPRFLSYRLTVFWIVSTVVWLAWWVLLAAGLATGEEEPLIAASLAALFLVPIQLAVWFALRVDYDLRYYIVTDRSLRVREGAWVVKEMTISFANVQNLRVVQGPIMRLFGIRHLKVDTAGGGGGSSAQGKEKASGHEVQMAGIENAHEVRDLILRRLRAQGGAGLGDHDDEAGRTGARAASAALVAAARELRDASAGLRRAAEARA